MDQRTFLDNFGVIADAPNGIATLRELVYSFATNGKLTSQSSEEAPPLIGVATNDLPDNWRRCSLDAIAQYGGSGQVASKDIPEDSWLLDLEDIEKGSSALVNRVLAKNRATKSTKAKFYKGDVLYGKLRPYLDKVLVAPENGFCTTEIVPIAPSEHILAEYLVVSMKSPNFLGYVNEKSYGMKMPRLGTKDALASIHNVPPLAEQKRVVAKVEELMVLCDELAAEKDKRETLRTAARASAIDAISTATTAEELSTAWSRISSNWDDIVDSPESIDKLRQLIISFAVKGLLTRRSEIAESEHVKPFDNSTNLDESKLWLPSSALSVVPRGWLRTPMGTLGKWGSGGTPTSTRKEYYTNGTIPWAVIGDLNEGALLNTEKSITEKAMVESSATLIPKGSVLIAMYGASIGKTAVTAIECTSNQAIAHCSPGPHISAEYLLMLAKSLKSELIKSGQGAAQPNISQTVIKHLLVDVPPLRLQNETVAKVDELMTLCNEIEAYLNIRSEIESAYARASSQLTIA
jgi:type I restriction enzyme S subunit